MSGYDKKFLGGNIQIPLPTFSRSLGQSVLRKPGILRDGLYSDHIHFTLVMNKQCLSNSDNNIKTKPALMWHETAQFFRKEFFIAQGAMYHGFVDKELSNIKRGYFFIASL